MKSRKQLNLEVLDELRDYICKNPEQRFGQALRNVGIVDTICFRDNIPELDGVYFTNIFYEEPEITLKRIQDERSKRTEG